MAYGDLPGHMSMAFRAAMDRVHAKLAELGYGDVRPAHGFVFQLLSHTNGSTAVEIAAHLGVTKQAATQLLAELETRGYIKREGHPLDRRARLVSLTERGWLCVSAVVDEWRAIEDDWAALVGPERLDVVRDAVGAIVADASAKGQVTMKPLW